MRIRKIVVVVIMYCLFFLFLGLFATGLQYLVLGTPKMEWIEHIRKNFLFIIGYGETVISHDVATNLLALAGVISLAFLSARLTFNLFWRTRDVPISETAAVWQVDGLYYLSLLIGNRGKDICNVELELAFYNAKSSTIEPYPEKKTFPIIKRDVLWKIDIPLNNDAFFRSQLRHMKISSTGPKLIATYRYTDTRTGQESIQVHEYDGNDIYATGKPRGFTDHTSPSKRFDGRFKQFRKKNLGIDEKRHSSFVGWLIGNSYPLDLKLLRPINEGAIKLHCEDKNLAATVNFTLPNELGDIPPFVMAAFLRHHDPIDWTRFYEQNAEISLVLHSPSNLNYLLMEAKSKNGKIYEWMIPVSQDEKVRSMPLRDIFSARNQCESLVELCFTIKPDFLAKSDAPAILFIDKMEIKIPDSAESTTHTASS